MADTNLETLVKYISDIVYNTTKISYLAKSVTYGSIYQDHGFRSNSLENSSIIPNTCWIRLVRANKVFMKKFLDWKINHYNRRGRGNLPQFIRLYNSCYGNRESSSRDSINNMLYVGVNVDRNVNLQGYHFNAVDIYNSFLFEDNKDGYSNNSRISITYFIHKLIFIGEKNFLIGLIDKEGILYLDYTILWKIYDKSVDEFKDLIIKIFSVYANVNSIFFKFNIRGLDEDISQTIENYLYARVNDLTKNCTIIEPEHIDIFSESNSIAQFVSKIKETVNREIRNYLGENYWGANSQYSFSDIISNIISSRAEEDNRKIEEAFFKGLLYGNKFELSGWNISDRKFGDDREIVWEKEVNIVPCRAVYDKKLYNIVNNFPDWKNPFKIKTIYVTSSGKMYAEGNHPNVSSQKVCMGDISGKISFSDPKKLGENLNKCEALLTLINYDSAYSTQERENILRHSILDVSSRVEIDGEYIGDSEKLTDVCFEDEEDVVEDTNRQQEDESEEVTDDTNIEIINEEP